MAAGNACQSFEACIVEHLALTAKQFAGGKPRHLQDCASCRMLLAERLVDCGQQPNVRWPVPALERPTAIATATVFDPASLPPLSDQTVDLDHRYAGRPGQKVPHGALVSLAQCPVAEPTEQLAHKSVGARQILMFIVHSLVAFDEGPNLIHSV